MQSMPVPYDPLAAHTRITRPLYHGTNAIVNLFTNNAAPAKVLRKAALRLSNNIKPFKWIVKQTLTETKMAQRVSSDH